MTTHHLGCGEGDPIAIVTSLFLLASLSLQVGAVIVDSAGEKVLGEGWNRMPVGCEDKFEWISCKIEFTPETDILKTKYPYGEVYVV